MKKFDFKVVYLSLGLGLFAWVAAAVIDAVFFYYEGTIIELAITDLSPHELRTRSFFLAVFFVFGVIISHYMNKRQRAQELLRSILDNVIPVCVTNSNYEIVMANNSYNSIFKPLGYQKDHVKCFETRLGENCHTEKCPLDKILNGADKYSCETIKYDGQKGKKTYIVTATPFLNSKGERIGICESFQDITERRELEKDKDRLIRELKEALQKVNILSGLLPICASCKKIRDDKGYWSQIEHYLKIHSDAEFTHSICPECVTKLYPNFKPPEKDN